MKIIHIDDRFEPFAGYQTNELIEEHINNGNEVYVISSFDPLFSDKDTLLDQDKELKKKKGVTVIRLKETFKVASRYYYRDLNKVIEEINPDVVFSHYIGDFRDFWLFKKKKKYVLVRDCHMSWVASRNKFSKQFYWVYSHIFAPMINYTGKYFRVYALGVEEKQYIQALGIKEEKVEFLWHGYNKRKMYFSERDRVDIRRKLHLNPTDILIGYVGKFDKFKRPDLVFDIANGIDRTQLKDKKIKFLFLGKQMQNYMDTFNSKLDKFKFSSDVTVLSEKKFEELFKFYSAMDIMIWPKETTLSSIHAQVCRTKVIMENHESNKERVFCQENLYPVNDINAAINILNKNIKTLFQPEDSKSLEQFLVKREYSQQVKKIEEDWRDILESSDEK